ncbi:phosphatidylinositol-specific phospholipase C domain-containing protein, partial [Metamycoplasma neophronis]
MIKNNKNKNKLLKIGAVTIGSLMPVFSAPLISASNNHNNDTFNITYNKPNMAYWGYGNELKQDYSYWMEGLNDNLKMNELSIPGTHDSGMWNPNVFASWSQTQAYNYANQLKMGIRFFDIRIDRNLWIKHGSTASKTENLKTTLQAFKTFLKDHPSEFILVRIKDEDGSIKQGDKSLAKWGQDYLNTLKQFSDILFNTNNVNNFFSLDTSVRNLRGKVFVFNYMHHLISTSNYGGIQWWRAFQKETIQDQYEKLSIEQKEAEIVKMFNKTNNYTGPLMNINFISYANGWRPYKNAEEINPYVLNYLNKNQNLTNLGIVAMDFPGAGLSQAVWKTNFFYSDKDINERQIFGPKVTNVSINNINVINNTIQLNGNTQGFQADIVVYNSLRKSLKLNNNNAVISMAGQDLSVGDPIKIKLYKATPENPFYEQKFFNNISLEATVKNPPEYDALLNQIRTYLNNKVDFYKNQNLDLSNLVNEEIEAKLNTLNSYQKYTHDNYSKLKTINENLNNNDQILSNIQNELSLINNLIEDFENNRFLLHLKNTSNNIIFSLKYNLEKILNALISSTLSNDWSEENFALLNNKLIELKNNLLSLNEKMANDFRSFDFRMWPILSKYSWAQNAIITKYNALIIEIVGKINSLISESLIAEFNVSQNIEEINNLITTTQNRIETINTQLQINNFSAEQIELIAPKYINFIENGNQQIENVIQSDNMVNDLLAEVKEINANLSQFKAKYRFDKFSSESKEQYLNTLNNLNDNIARATEDSVNQEYLSAQINKLKLLEKTIEAEFIEYEKNNNLVNKIKALNNLSEEQKNLFIGQIKTGDEIEVLNSAKELNENLNYSIDILKALKNTIDTLDANLANQDIKENFKLAYNELAKESNQSINWEQIDTLINALKTANQKLIVSEELNKYLEITKPLIEAFDNIISYKKADLINRFNHAETIEKATEIYTEAKTLNEDNEPTHLLENKDISDSQKEAFRNKILLANSNDDLNRILQKEIPRIILDNQKAQKAIQSALEIQNSDYFNNLPSNVQNAFNTVLNNTKGYIKSIDSQKITEITNNLLLMNAKIVLIDLILNAADMYIFEKYALINETLEVNSNTELPEITSKIMDISDANMPSQDINKFANLSNNQKRNLQTELIKNSETENDKNNYLTSVVSKINDLDAQAELTINKYEKYISALNKDLSENQIFDQSYKKLSSIFNISDVETIKTILNDFQNSVKENLDFNLGELSKEIKASNNLLTYEKTILLNKVEAGDDIQSFLIEKQAIAEQIAQNNMHEFKSYLDSLNLNEHQKDSAIKAEKNSLTELAFNDLKNTLSEYSNYQVIANKNISDYLNVIKTFNYINASEDNKNKFKSAYEKAHDYIFSNPEYNKEDLVLLIADYNKTLNNLNGIENAKNNLKNILEQNNYLSQDNKNHFINNIDKANEENEFKQIASDIAKLNSLKEQFTETKVLFSEYKLTNEENEELNNIINNSKNNNLINIQENLNSDLNILLEKIKNKVVEENNKDTGNQDNNGKTDSHSEVTENEKEQPSGETTPETNPDNPDSSGTSDNENESNNSGTDTTDNQGSEVNNPDST